jgi:hypothetical protein
LLEHFLSSFNFSCAASSFPAKIATHNAIPCSLLLPSLYIWIVRYLFSFPSIILTASAGREQFLSSTVRSIICFWLPILFFNCIVWPPLLF